MPNRIVEIPWAVAVCCLIMVAALSGCTPVPVPHESASPTAPTVGGLPAGVTPAPLPTDVPNTVALRKDVKLTGCSGTAEQWKASGTATNSSNDAVKYTITIFFTTPAATVIDNAVTTVSVPAGESVPWTAEKQFATGGHVGCVLRGVG